jgi:hypothetical protein
MKNREKYGTVDKAEHDNKRNPPKLIFSSPSK